MTGNATWDALIFVVTVFCGGVAVAWGFWSQIGAKFEDLAEKFKAELKAASDDLKAAMSDGLSEAKEDRQSIRDSLEEFRKNDREEHKAMMDMITNLRIEGAAKPKGRTAKRR